MSDKLKKKVFDPYVNDTFNVVAGGVRVDLELIEVSERSYEGMESFSLLFKGDKDKFFNQQICKVTHEKMGEFDLFLTAVISEKKDAIYYEAAFSRLLEKE
ncbi:MAG: hypothetical protein GY765_39650 [bacterium]|nr:hypothetical protein [bacterium]